VDHLARSLLVWLMLLALPFQGMASAAMLSCAHGSTPAAVAGAEGHCHEQAAQPAADPHADVHDHDGRCSACADCCIGAALAPAPAVMAAPSAPPAMFASFALHHPAAVDLDLPERPPRFPLA